MIYGYTLPPNEEHLRRFLVRSDVVTVCRTASLPDVQFSSWSHNPAPYIDQNEVLNPHVFAKVQRDPPPTRVLYSRSFFAQEEWLQHLCHAHECLHLAIDETLPTPVQNAPGIVRLFQAHVRGVSPEIFWALKRLAAIPIELTVESRLLALLPREQLRFLRQELLVMADEACRLPLPVALTLLLAHRYRIQHLLVFGQHGDEAARSDANAFVDRVTLLVKKFARDPFLQRRELLDAIADFPVARPGADTYLDACRRYVSALLTKLSGRPVEWSEAAR